MFAGKKSAQIREILISESAWEEMTCLFAPSLAYSGKDWPSHFNETSQRLGKESVILLHSLCSNESINIELIMYVH
ncbi:hypothetical protein FR760_22140 [Enterobacter hormaechei]|nr:hypothetical protein FR760_22140 [Enterobacter hormaechei]